MFKKLFSQLVLLPLLAVGAFSQTNQPAALTAETLPPLASCKQLLLVTTADWQAVPGKMRRFARTNAESPGWKWARSFPSSLAATGWAGAKASTSGKPAWPRQKGRRREKSGGHLSVAFGVRAG